MAVVLLWQPIATTVDVDADNDDGESAMAVLVVVAAAAVDDNCAGHDGDVNGNCDNCVCTLEFVQSTGE